MDTLCLESRAIAWRYNGDWLRIEAHGPDGLRLRASTFPATDAKTHALLDTVTHDGTPHDQPLRIPRWMLLSSSI